MNQEKPEDILIARLAADLQVWIESAWIIGRIRSRDTVDVFGAFGQTSDPAQWPGYLDAISICAEAETLASIDSQLRRRNLVTIFFPIETGGHIAAVLAIGPRNRNQDQQYSAADVAVMRALGAQIGNVLRARTTVLQDADDLDIAPGIQDRLLPSRVPHISGVECSALCERVGQLGGDFFELSDIDGGSLMAAIGNVAVSGNSGCILMTVVQACLRSLGRRVQLPELFDEVNRMFWDVAPDKAYSTLFAAHVSPDRKSLQYVNAGHQTPLILRRNGRVDRLEPNAAVLGLTRGSAYRERTVPFRPGDTLIALSEGISEPAVEVDIAAHEASLIRMVQHDRGVRLRELPAQIIESIESLAGPHVCDRTVVVVHFRIATPADAVRELRTSVEHPIVAAA